MRMSLFGSACLVICLLASCEQAISQQISGEITETRRNGNEWVITYTLNAPPDVDYEVTLYVMRENDPLSKRKLASVKGEVGEGKYAGVGRKIYWDGGEFPNAIEGMNYQFALNVRMVKGGGLPWYLYAGAAAVGGVAYFAIVKKESPPPQQQTSSIPLPPPRP